jgi:hypothetical protein
VDQLARAFALIAPRRLEPNRPSLPIPIRIRIPDTVETSRPNSSAISGPANRTRRSAAITTIVRSSVRLATVTGADE